MIMSAQIPKSSVTSYELKSVFPPWRNAVVPMLAHARSAVATVASPPHDKSNKRLRARAD